VVVDEHLRAAREAWPDVVVEPARFASELARRVGDGDVASVRGADVYVAIACIDGDERAIEIVRDLLAKEVGFAAQKTRATPDQIAEVTAALSKILFVDEPGRSAAMRDYAGRAALKGYLKVIATRELVRVVNRGRREVALPDDDLIDRIVPASDPEISILRARYRDDVDAAIRAAITTLDDRGRALLRYAFVDGLNVDRVGELYDVHRATAARWIAAVRERLGTQIRTELAARLAVGVDDVDSIIRLVQSRVELSLDRMLQSES
jgi:RNA polymerase sigma-70 factor (ECF subfamily)